MENPILIQLSIDYGLSEDQLRKVISLVNQAGAHESDPALFKDLAVYICENELVDEPAEEVLEELRLKKLA